MDQTQPRVLIEDWLPVAELGIESRRERAVVTTIPPLNWLHVWWARRPLVASAAVVLTGLLPAWSHDLAAAFPDSPHLANEKAYRAWVLHLVGIWGDPIAARKVYDQAVASGIRIPNPYTYKQAYKNSPGRPDLDLLHAILRRTWGELPLVSDPTAGGGSIPFTAARLGIPTHANDLNSVAAAVLKAGVEYPSTFGSDLLPHLKRWGGELVSRVERELKPYFPSGPGEQVATYLFANAVACPRTGRLVPLLTDKWLRKDKGQEAAVRLITDTDGVALDQPLFEVVHGRQVKKTDADQGTVARGTAISLYDNLVISGDHIKAEAQAGRMTQVLYAVAIRTPDGKRSFRTATQADRDALRAASVHLAEVRADWEATDILPTEEFPAPIAKHDIRPYGFATFSDFFTDRQLLVHGTFGHEFRAIAPEVMDALGEETGTAVLVELALMQGKALNWNSRMSSWDVSRQKMRSVFDRHDYSFKWTFAEFEGATALYGWCFDRVVAAYEQISQLLDETGVSLMSSDRLNRTVTVTQGSATTLALDDGAVTHLCMDPPYYDNVMYAELADFFYVWEKRTIGALLQHVFDAELSDKDNEAVANPARFEAMGKRKNELATLDYETKMTAIFGECRRVLRDDGVLSVMFTHKRAEAWDTLGMGLLRAGFTIETSWPVNTESEQSLHQANVNAAASTIMLVCRKRPEGADGRRTFLDDIESEVRQAARDAATRFEQGGILGVDLLLSTYGPTLSVISQNWPVYSTDPDESGREQLLRPEQALDLAREEVVRLRRDRLVGHAARVDDYTDFVLLAWDIFAARGFPFDTARLLALAVGGTEMDDLAQAKIVEKKAGTVRLLTPAERLRRDADSPLPGVKPDATRFDHMIDAVDTALYITDIDGAAAARRFLDRAGLTENAGFLATVQGLVNAIPRTKVKGSWAVPEAGLLDTLVTAYLPTVVLPPEEAQPPVHRQSALFGEEE